MFGSYLENFLGDGVNWETTIGCSGWIPSNDYWCYYPGSGSVTQWQLYQCSNTGARKAVRRAWDTCCIPSCC
jgi:hypothetical protein